MPFATAGARRTWQHKAGLGTAVVFMFSVTAVVLAVLVVTVVNNNPFKMTTTEHSDSVVLARIHDLARFDAATGRFQTLVDQEKKNEHLPEWAVGEHVVLAAEGDVEATVDFSHLGDGAIQMSADGKHATVHVPAPALSQPRLDPDSTRVISRDRGVLNRIGDAASNGDTIHQDQLEQRAQDKILTAAQQSDLQDRAKRNTEQFLRDTLKSSGVEDVTVVFDPPATPPPT